MKPIEIYTDGSCSIKKNSGGFGAVILSNGNKKELCEGYFNTTNNRMELLGVIKSLKELKVPCNVVVYSDSRYVTDSVNNKWIYNWHSNGWRYSPNGSKEVRNCDLWKQLYKLLTFHNVDIKWIKGHSGNFYNDRADELAALSHFDMPRKKLKRDMGHAMSTRKKRK